MTRRAARGRHHEDRAALLGRTHVDDGPSVRRNIETGFVIALSPSPGQLQRSTAFPRDREYSLLPGTFTLVVDPVAVGRELWEKTANDGVRSLRPGGVGHPDDARGPAEHEREPAPTVDDPRV